MPELLRDGVTGWLVAGADEAVDAVAKLDRLDRAGCRIDAVTRFSAARMVADYERLFARVIS
jgi:glycosyltransferase involved in cell wall biosynthesis